MTNELIPVIAILVLVYAYVLARLVCSAYFKSKLHYQHTLLSTIAKGGFSDGKSH